MYLTKAQYIYDGDTFKTDIGKIRLASIDAPELKQPLGPEARSFLAKLIEGRAISIVPLGKDAYDRVVAQVLVEGRDISEMLVMAGMAFPYFPHPIHASRIDRAAAYAQRLKLGVWSSLHETPQNYRKRQREHL